MTEWICVTSSASSLRHLLAGGRQAAGQQLLPEPGGPTEQHIVRACGRDLERALDMLLPHDVAEVRQALLRLLGLPDRLRLDGEFAAQMGGQLPPPPSRG